jgi:exodeoxyribonuclease V gamma subunit
MDCAARTRVSGTRIFTKMPDSPGVQVFTSAQLTPLRDHLVQRLCDDPLPPREPETIVVQSQGMRRWITLQIADALGCAGSLALPFPAHFSHAIADRVAGDRPVDRENDPFSRDALTWRLDTLLRALPVQDPGYGRLREYLHVSDDRMRLGLAARIAGRFDEYQLYRPDVLVAWEDGRDTPDSPHTAWQASLWRTLCAADVGGAEPLPRRFGRALDALKSGAPAGLPPRVTVFGVSSLPPLFLDLLESLARHVPVWVYAAVLNEASAHPIARAFGGQGRELLKLVRERGASITRVETVASPRAGVLATLQGELASENAGNAPLALSANDSTLRIHDAHGQVRQLEVVRDQLLDALAADPTLRPHDLLLLVPDAAEWAPTVDAVFGVAAVDEAPRIPYNIADRPRRSAQPAADAFLRLLALEGGRFARSEVFGFLEHPLVRQAAELTDIELEEVRTLTGRANVRWGYDAESRRALGLPAYEEASWRAGLDRLLLGYVVGDSDDAVLGVLPEAGDTAGDPETVGRLAKWIDHLASTLASWHMRRPVAEWSAALLEATRDFLQASDRRDQQTIETLQDEVRRLGALAGVAGHHDNVSFGVIRDWLETQLTDDSFGTGFLIGGMTVAALKPMRSIPFRVIAVVGLDDETFPRRDRRAAFDLLALNRREGDRDLRGDDRQLFLDLLLAAQDRLVLTFGGRAVHDNSRRAPSVVIDELLGHLDRRSDGAARERIVVEHPLQPFGNAYFVNREDPRIFTYSTAQARAAQARTVQGDVDRPFVAEPLEVEPATGARVVTLNDLADLWTNPSKYFCQRVLRLSLDGGRDEVPDEELFALAAITQGSVKSRMLAAGLTGRRDPARDRRGLGAEGLLPPGDLGSSWYSTLATGVDDVIARVSAAAPSPPSAPVLISVDNGDWRLSGRIDGIRGNVRVVARAGRIRPEHRIRAWVQHVAMCAARETGITGLPDTTLLIGEDETEGASIGAVPHARAVLAALIGELAGGWCAPLPFFAQAGWCWFEAGRLASNKKLRKGFGPRDPVALAKAAYAKQANDWVPLGGDGEDAYVALCFRGADPMESRWREFERLASVLFGAWPQSAAGA